MDGCRFVSCSTRSTPPRSPRPTRATAGAALNRAGTPRTSRHSPPPRTGRHPLQVPALHHSHPLRRYLLRSQRIFPSSGGKIRRPARVRATGTAGKPKTPDRRGGGPRLPHGAGELYRALPGGVAGQISERGSRRVLEALAAQLEHRSVAELAERIARNWEHWRWRLLAGEPVRDPVALAIRLTRRGLDCPDVRCEDGHQLDLDTPCKACALTAARRTALDASASDHDAPGADTASRRAPIAGPGGDETGADHRGFVSAAGAAETKPWA